LVDLNLKHKCMPEAKGGEMSQNPTGNERLAQILGGGN
jgi:hypothetical protein